MSQLLKSGESTNLDRVVKHTHSGGVEGGSDIGPVSSLTASANLDIGPWNLQARTLQSNVSTGTAPFSVASTTVVTNLNADLLDGESGNSYHNASNINAGTLAIAYGGTNSNTALSGSSIIVSDGSKIIQGNTGSSTTVLHGNLNFGSVSLTADVSGTLPIGNGGSGSTGYLADRGIIYYDSSSDSLKSTAQGASNTVLHGNGSGIPTFSSIAINSDTTGTLPISRGGTGSTSFPVTGAIPYYNGTALVGDIFNFHWDNVNSRLNLSTGSNIRMSGAGGDENIYSDGTYLHLDSGFGVKSNARLMSTANFTNLGSSGVAEFHRHNCITSWAKVYTSSNSDNGTIIDSFNINSSTLTSDYYTVTFSTDLANADYAVLATHFADSISNTTTYASADFMSTSSYAIRIKKDGGGSHGSFFCMTVGGIG